jgi:D-alanyl-D-alanine carboxypeptidase (penicillin-binding protein 5/6)
MVFLLLALALASQRACALVEAASAILVDAETGKTLWAKDPQRPMPPASLTKIMTALLIVESGRLDEEASVSEAAASVRPGAMGLKMGELASMRDLLTAALLRSANDACVAAAEHLSGSEAGFVKEMNKRAKQLGAERTNFANCHGLYAPGHLSTAADLALITRHALRHSMIRRLVRMKCATLPSLGVEIQSHNKLLWKMPCADGVKTGYVKESGKCLVASATRDGNQLVAVLLNSPQPFEEAQRLLEHGFRNFRKVRWPLPGRKAVAVAVSGGERSTVELRPRRRMSIVVPVSQREPVEIVAERPEYVAAPVRNGQVLGRARMMVGGKVLVSSPLLAASDVGRSLALRILRSAGFVTIALIVLALVIRTAVLSWRRMRKHRR